jgi:DNA processing protein
MHDRPWLERAATFFTHAAAQLCYRWLPPPVLPPCDGFFASTLEAAPDARSRWTAFIAWARHEHETFPWLRDYRRHFDPELSKLFQAIVAQRGALLLHGDPDYPPALAALADPPLALSYVGERALFGGDLTAIVGSRKASARALAASFELGRRLASSGKVVVSGGALGCDIAAHAGVLAAHRRAGAAAQQGPAPAILIFAGGLSSLYPRANAAVFAALRERGALFVSERLWDAPSRPADFPARNRIISGLCATTVVMQAAQRSGAMLTARLALDQGREVLVLSHPPGDIRASGSAALIAEGATTLQDAVSTSICPALDTVDK